VARITPQPTQRRGAAATAGRSVVGALRRVTVTGAESVRCGGECCE
jgi:hypothetical protein